MLFSVFARLAQRGCFVLQLIAGLGIGPERWALLERNSFADFQNAQLGLEFALLELAIEGFWRAG